MTRFLTASGSYTGNGGTQAVTVGWQPKAVVIMGSRSSGSTTTRAASFKTDTMPGDGFMRVGSGSAWVLSNGITLTGSGFSLGSLNYLNRNGWTFYWLAFGACPCVNTGSFVGDASVLDETLREVTVGRGPEVLLLFREGATPNTALLVGEGQWDDTLFWTTGAGNVQSSPGGYRVKNGSGVGQNVDQVTYHHLALFGFAGETAYAFSGVRVASGSQLNIGTVRQPKVVLVFRDNLFGLKVPAMDPTGCGLLGPDYTYTSTGGIGINPDGFSVYSSLHGAGTLRWFAVHGEGP